MDNRLDFSVVIPTYNSSTYISKAIDSIASTAEQMSFEILLIDDCSDDYEVLLTLAVHDERIRVVKKKSKSNAADSRKIGFLSSSADTVFFLDSDDCFINEAIKRRLTLHKELKAGIIFGEFIIATNEKKAKSNLPIFNGQDMRDYLFLEGSTIRSSTISIHKPYHKQAMFDERSEKHQDWIFGLNCTDCAERIVFDELPSVEIHDAGLHRMSLRMNLRASQYFVKQYLNSPEHINGFSRRHWVPALLYKDIEACKYFSSIYSPSNTRNTLSLNIFKALSFKATIYPMAYFIKKLSDMRSRMRLC